MILIALGSNLPHPDLGPAPAVFDAAVEMLRNQGLHLVKRSNLYDNAAVGPGEQPDYCNAAIHMEGRLKPHEVLKLLLHIEKELGRERVQRWGPRIIDLDLIAVDAQIKPSKQAWLRLAADVKADPKKSLILPHPRAHQRDFVLQPLLDVAPGWEHPVLKKTVQRLAQDLNEGHELHKRIWT
ncbi:MAG: 2-amino-4-hydroxy-6-hydroxymethyldihydropteridine diphosphokinase [Sphingomonadales bacterium]|jgi:2-amino-4-hydroxy-6-hydroxymethyldihydropteridine diphosphokinase